MVQATGGNSRFLDALHRAADLGNTQIFLHGSNISDDWFFEIGFGVHDLRRTIAYGMLQKRQLAEQLVLLSKTELGLFEYLDGEICYRPLGNANELETALRPDASESEPRDDLADSGGPHADAARQAAGGRAPAEPDGAWLINNFARISELMTDCERPFAVLVDGLHWVAELFPRGNPRLEYLEEIEKWKRLSLDRLHRAVITVPELDWVQDYFGVGDGDSRAVYVGGPSVDEIRRTLEKLSTSGNFRYQTYAEMVSALKNKGLNLLNAVRYFKSFMDARSAEATADQRATVEAFKRVLELPVETVRWEDVILDEDARWQIEDTFSRFLAGDGQDVPKGLLLHGPPGTGKTHIAKALANRGGCYFLPLKLADLKGEFVGHSGKNVQRIFSEARASAPTLMFIDEIDTVFSSRGSANQDSFSADIVNQFLAEADGVDTGMQRIFIVGATNRLDMVDTAVKSRLTPLSIALPGAALRDRMLRRELDSLLQSGVIAPAQMQDLVERTDGLSGRDIHNLALKIGQLVANGHVSPIDAALAALRDSLRSELADNGFSIRLSESLAEQPGLAAIHGYGPEKGRLTRVMQALLHRDARLTSLGVPHHNGILLYGPPGNGKSYFAERLACEYGLDVVVVSSPQVSAGYIDASIRQFDSIVDKAIRFAVLRPTLVFFDEFDALAGGEMGLKFRGALLTGINRLRRSPNIVLMAATNNLRLLDPASCRRGRFDEHIELPNPEAETIAELVQCFLDEGPFEFSGPPDDLRRLAQRWQAQRFCVMDVKYCCDDAKIAALGRCPGDALAGPYRVTLEDLDSSISVEAKDRD